MATKAEMVSRVISIASLKSVMLKRSYADIALPPAAISPDITKLDISYSFHHVFAKEEMVLFSFVAASAVGTLKPEVKDQHPELLLENDQLFCCHCTFVAHYDLTEVASDQECEAFTTTNALFNVYPYLRHHIDVIMTKTGISGVVLPLLKPSLSEEKPE